jgi:hypothetical protein
LGVPSGAVKILPDTFSPLARAWMLAKHGDIEQAAETYARTREQVLPNYSSDFDKIYKTLSQLIDPSAQLPAKHASPAPPLLQPDA